MLKILTLLTLLSSTVAFAAKEDPIFLNVASYSPRGPSLIETGFGPPPVHLGSILWINSFAYREISLKQQYLGRDLNPTVLAYTSLFRKSLGSNWNSSLLLNISTRNTESGIHKIRSRSIFTTGVLLFSRHMNTNKTWSFSFGAVLPGKSSTAFAFPAVGFRYRSLSGMHEATLSFPELYYHYKPNRNWQFGTFFRYEKATYLLSDDLIRINENNIYLAHTTVTTGALVAKNIWQGMWGKFIIGHTIRARSTVLDQNYESQTEVTRKNGLYVLAGLSWRFGHEK